MFDEFAIFSVEHQHTAIVPIDPPSGRHVDLLAVQGDRRSIAAQSIGLLPGDLVSLEVEGADAGMLGGEVSAVGLEVGSEAAQAFFEDRDIDAPHQLMAVIDIEDQNTGAVGLALNLGRIRCAEVEVAFDV